MIQRDKLKSRYRICQIGDKYYIQVNTLFGWSFDTLTDVSGEEYTSLSITCMLFIFFSLIVLILTIVTGLFEMKYNMEITYSLISTIIFVIIYKVYKFKSKKVSITCDSLSRAENTIDNLVNMKLEYLYEKEKEKNIKYHYFYTDKQLRLEKLKKLK